jgi:hypothetical protein
VLGWNLIRGNEPISNLTAHDVSHISSFPSLVEILRDKLDWPIGDDYGFDDIVYDYDAQEFGLKPEEAAKIREIHQLRPLVTNQPWGIFFISFEEKIFLSPSCAAFCAGWWLKSGRARKHQIASPGNSTI